MINYNVPIVCLKFLGPRRSAQWDIPVGEGIKRARRGGFTLVETLVVVSIVGRLLALVVPAVQGARESARRLECVNHLKQLGVALAQHHGQRNAFPAAIRPEWRRPPYLVAGSPLPGLYDLLPFLGEAPLFHSLNVSFDTSRFVLEAAINRTAKQARVATFLCPSDARLPANGPGPNSYRFNTGLATRVTGATPGDYLHQGAAFRIFRTLSAADFRDGLSRTVGMSERVCGSGPGRPFDPARDLWYAGVSGLVEFRDADQLLKVCGGLSGTSGEFLSQLGYSWSWPGYGANQYNHVVPPNAAAPDCSAEPKGGSNETNEESTYASVAARSQHSGGVVALFMDGSVTFIKSGINPTVWRALGTRSGGETIDGGY